MWGIFCGIPSIPYNIVMDKNDVMYESLQIIVFYYGVFLSLDVTLHRGIVYWTSATFFLWILADYGVFLSLALVLIKRCLRMWRIHLL